MALTFRLPVLTTALLLSSALPREALAQTPRYTLETTASLGWGIMSAGRFDRGPETSSTNGGFAAGLLFALRSPYFLTPWFEIGYAKLYSSTLRVEENGLTTVAQASMTTRAVVLGPAVDLWRFRLGLGLGFYNLGVSSNVGGSSLSVSEWDMGYSFMVGGRILTYGRFRLGLQLRGLLIIEAEVNTLSLLVDLGFDALRW